MTTGNPEQEGSASERAARIIAQALAEAEVIIAADRDVRSPQITPELVDALSRFGDILTRLIDHSEQMSVRIDLLSAKIDDLAQARPVAAPATGGAKPQLPEMEPSFAPGGEGVDVAIAGVPGFQGLMEVQRALVRLQQVQSAAVRRYQDDEAAIQLILSQPMAATAIAEAITAATGTQVIVDDSRPESLRLRLRFL
jgi:hypothetical protein